MSILVIGPTSSGKSTFIKQAHLHKQINSDNLRLVHAFEINSETCFENIILHYNLLDIVNWPALSKPGFHNVSLKDDERFKTILANKSYFHETVVLVTDPAVLKQRILQRKRIELHIKAHYPSHYWYETVKRLDLKSFYDDLFFLLESEFMMYRVFLSSQSVNESFMQIDKKTAYYYFDDQHYSDNRLVTQHFPQEGFFF